MLHYYCSGDIPTITERFQSLSQQTMARRRIIAPVIARSTVRQMVEPDQDAKHGIRKSLSEMKFQVLPSETTEKTVAEEY